MMVMANSGKVSGGMVLALVLELDEMYSSMGPATFAGSNVVPCPDAGGASSTRSSATWMMAGRWEGVPLWSRGTGAGASPGPGRSSSDSPSVLRDGGEESERETCPGDRERRLAAARRVRVRRLMGSVSGSPGSGGGLRAASAGLAEASAGVARGVPGGAIGAGRRHVEVSANQLLAGLACLGGASTSAVLPGVAEERANSVGQEWCLGLE
jgi:hypothetical protein